MARIGRPPQLLNFTKLESLLIMRRTLHSIAKAMRCSEDTIERRIQRKYGVGFRELQKRLRHEFLTRVLGPSAAPGAQPADPPQGLDVIASPDLSVLDGASINFAAMSELEQTEVMRQVSAGLPPRTHGIPRRCRARPR